MNKSMKFFDGAEVRTVYLHRAAVMILQNEISTRLPQKSTEGLPQIKDGTILQPMVCYLLYKYY